MDVFSQECLFAMRGFVSPGIFSASLASLVGEDGISEPLAKRLLNKKCLWLLRMETEDIQKMHEADLLGRLTSLLRCVAVLCCAVCLLIHMFPYIHTTPGSTPRASTWISWS